MKRLGSFKKGFVLLETIVALTIICGCLTWTINTWNTWNLEKRQNILLLEKERARLDDLRKKI